MSAELIQSWVKTWLQRQPDTTRFEAVDCRKCPLAVFLKSRGAKDPAVGTAYMTADARGLSQGAVNFALENLPEPLRGRRPLPKWAQVFVHRFDIIDGKTVAAARVVLATIDKPWDTTTRLLVERSAS